MQIEVDNLKQHQISHKSLSASFEARESGPREIEKSEKVLIRLKEIAEKGFSPSALTSYIRNPLDFYYQKILRVKEADDLEETVDYSTLGTVVHNTLENLYKPYEGALLSKEILDGFKKEVDKEVLTQFEECYKEGTIDKGKNLIIFEVAKRYVTNLINLDIKEINQGNSIKLLHVEIELKANLDITEIDFPVSIGGKVDRIDMINEQLRIVDYKTGNVTQGDLEIVDWDILTQDYKYSKAFQVLAYSLMCQSELKYNSMEAGIISFRNLGSGFLKFAKKDAPRSKTKQTDVSEDILNSFKQQLISLISEICDPDVPFIEKEL
ncbi:MAG: PD-(D/E)XK nuclease family protein [Flavobacteriaceae bacterium]|nr:PD-(D/E)XK nuclease family protein [Flavobacteriaceae bacterium]